MIDDARNKHAKHIKSIKTKQRQLGMDQTTYQAMLLARTGHTSSKDCTLIQLGLVNDYLTSCGAVNPNAKAMPTRRIHLAADRQSLRQQVDSLLLDLAARGLITDPVKYGNGICQRNGWCTSVEFADAHILHKLVGALSRTLRGRTKAANARA